MKEECIVLCGLMTFLVSLDHPHPDPYCHCCIQRRITVVANMMWADY